ncbi:MAG TPA: arsenite S-adenosylmethyltransferase, partial [Candidatus Bathyarchaeia archaeon]|nr:arsenite S-adenosylmethyltransferase [Candidatus Bathyarchaeia archaeon]
LSFGEFRAGLEAVGLGEIEVRPTHAVADGLYGAIIRAVKPADWTPTMVRAIDLPRPAATLSVIDAAGCCGDGCGCG